MNITERYNLHCDLNFLLDRAMQAGKCDFTENCDSGKSSNSIVAIAYGLIEQDEQKFPSDGPDLRSCENMFEKLPKHRRTKNVMDAMDKARNSIRATQ